jgi:ELWxxDGT repeat protein
MVKNIVSGETSAIESLANVGGTLFFVGSDPTAGRELWKSDGTESGTVRVRDIYTGSDSSFPSDLTSAQGMLLYFVADDGIGGRELWVSNGTEAGTMRVADIYAGIAGSEPQHLTLAGDAVFFSADDGASGRELWALTFDIRRVYLPLVLRQ